MADEKIKKGNFLSDLQVYYLEPDTHTQTWFKVVSLVEVADEVPSAR